jgi:hypothetical protein
VVLVLVFNNVTTSNSPPLNSLEAAAGGGFGLSTSRSAAVGEFRCSINESCVPDEVFDDTVYHEMAIPVRMTIAWGDIAAVEMSAMRLPDRALRILALIHHNGGHLKCPKAVPVSLIL